MQKIPHRFAPIVFGLLLAGMMSFLVSGIATFRAIGLAPDFFARWIAAWIPSYAVAFPAVLVVAPLVRKFVAAVCQPPPGGKA